jgi:adenylate cyclase
VAGDLRAYLLAAGASEAEIERATAEGWLPLLAFDRMLIPGVARYDVSGVTAAAGTDPEVAGRIWRALGFPDLPVDVTAFTERDADALRFAVERLQGDGDLTDLEHQVRIVAATLARLTAFEADVVAQRLDAIRATGVDEESAALELIDETDWDGLSALIDYTHRLLLRAAVWRRLARPASGPSVDLAVGFADMAGYTELSEGLDERELSELLASFEKLAYDTAAELNGRIVKSIGDEVMFVGFPHDVARIALALAERATQDPVVPDVRVGVASGTVLARDGDYYGPVVNLASRITARARLGTVLTSSGFHAALADDPDLAWRRLGAKRVRGIGVVELYVLRRGE